MTTHNQADGASAEPAASAPKPAAADPIETLNGIYFLIDVGAETVVGQEVVQHNATRQWSEICYRSFEDFKKKLVKEFCNVRQRDGKIKITPLADAWLRHPRGRQYDKLVYAPEGSAVRVGPRDLNGWRGFTVKPAPGNWSQTRTFMRDIICGGNDALLDWLLDWCAALFQRPGEHAETAPVLIGPQGIGKNFFFDKVLGWCFDGRHATTVLNMNSVFGDFNDRLSGVVLLTLDEVNLTPAQSIAIRGLITGDHLDINRKHIARARERSMLHVGVLSNSAVPVTIDNDDRRFAYFAVSNARANDTEFFGRIASELDEQGGRAAMLHDLLARPIGRDVLRLAPNTKAKQAAKRESWTPAQWFFFRMLLGRRDEWKTHLDLRRIKKADTIVDYHNYLRETNVRREVKDARSELHAELKKLVPAGWDFNRAVSDGGVLSRDYWTLPDWQTFQASFALAVGCDLRELLAADQSEPEQPALTPSEQHFADADAPTLDVESL